MARNGRGILSLETLEDSKFFIEIDGKKYWLLGKRDIGFRTWGRIVWLNAQIQSVNDGPDSDTEKGFAELEEYVTEMTKLIGPSIPDAVLAKLTGFQKLQICEAFSEATNPKTNTETSPAEEVKTETTA